MEKAKDSDANIRFWGVLGLVVASQSAGPEMAEGIKDSLKAALNDESISVRLTAAEGLCNFGDYADAAPALVYWFNVNWKAGRFD